MNKIKEKFPEICYFIENPKEYELLYYKEDDIHNQYALDVIEAKRIIEFMNILQKDCDQLRDNYERIYNENCKLRERHNIIDISLLDENYKLESNWNKLKEYLNFYIKLMNNNPDIIEQGQLDILYEVKDIMQELGGNDGND